MRTPKFTNEAKLNIQETGIAWAIDLVRLTELGWTIEEMLASCLEGADPDRVQGWHDYVDALVECQ